MRNQIYILSEISRFEETQERQCAYIDVGKTIATSYENNEKEFEQGIKNSASKYIEKIIQGKISEDKTRIVFCNIGILLEKDFRLNVSNFLLEFAKEYNVFLIWPNDAGKIIDGKTLVWNVENPRDKIEFDEGVLLKA